MPPPSSSSEEPHRQPSSTRTSSKGGGGGRARRWWVPCGGSADAAATKEKTSTKRRPDRSLSLSSSSQSQKADAGTPTTEERSEREAAAQGTNAIFRLPRRNSTVARSLRRMQSSSDVLEEAIFRADYQNLARALVANAPGGSEHQSTASSSSSEQNNDASSSTDSTRRRVAVAGHARNIQKQDPEWIRKTTNATEIAFYEDKAWPSKYLPRYGGRFEDGVILEDVTLGFRRPCVMDVKMGTTTAGQRDPRFKRMRLKMTDSLTGTKQTGARIVGFSVYHPKNGDTFALTRRRAFLASMNYDALSVLAFYLSDGRWLRSELLSAFYALVYDLIKHFERQKEYIFVGSSLLLVYDGKRALKAAQNTATRLRRAARLALGTTTAAGYNNASSGTTTTEETTDAANAQAASRRTKSGTIFGEDAAKRDSGNERSLHWAYRRQQLVDGVAAKGCRLVMIDFAKTRRQEGNDRRIDEGYLTGLRTLADHLETLAATVELHGPKLAAWPEDTWKGGAGAGQDASASSSSGAAATSATVSSSSGAADAAPSADDSGDARARGTSTTVPSDTSAAASDAPARPLETSTPTVTTSTTDAAGGDDDDDDDDGDDQSASATVHFAAAAPSVDGAGGHDAADEHAVGPVQEEDEAEEDKGRPAGDSESVPSRALG